MHKTVQFKDSAVLNGVTCNRAVVNAEDQGIMVIDFLLDKGRYTTLKISRGDLMNILKGESGDPHSLDSLDTGIGDAKLGRLSG